MLRQKHVQHVKRARFSRRWRWCLEHRSSPTLCSAPRACLRSRAFDFCKTRRKLHRKSRTSAKVLRCFSRKISRVLRRAVNFFAAIHARRPYNSRQSCPDVPLSTFARARRQTRAKLREECCRICAKYRDLRRRLSSQRKIRARKIAGARMNDSSTSVKHHQHHALYKLYSS